MKKETPKASRCRDIRKDAWPLWLWFASTLLAVIVVTAIGTAWAVRHAEIEDPRLSKAQSRIFIALSTFPSLVRSAILQLSQSFGGDPTLLLIDRKSSEQPHWIRHFPAPEDPGYLLFSGVDPVQKRSVVQLIRISDGITVARWDPDWKVIFEQITSKKYAPVGNQKAARAVHPLLLADGDIIFNNVSSLLIFP